MRQSVFNEKVHMSSSAQISGPGKSQLTSQLKRAKRESTSLRGLLLQERPKTPATSLHWSERGDATPRSV